MVSKISVVCANWTGTATEVMETDKEAVARADVEALSVSDIAGFLYSVPKLVVTHSNSLSFVKAVLGEGNAGVGVSGKERLQ